jgi:hypothetical protein
MLICALVAGNAQARTAPYRVQTIPALAGVEVDLQGKTYRTDSKGLVVLEPNNLTTDLIKPATTVHDLPLGPNAVARFDRWYGRNTLTFNIYYRVQFRFEDLSGAPVPPALVDILGLKSRTGVHTTLPHGRAVWLQGTRVVPFTGQLVSKDIEYQVERAFVDGTNVVNRAEQRFAPRTTKTLAVRLLFYSLKVKTRDALLGFPIGSAVELRYPSGRVVQHALKDGQVTLPALPRGTYNVKVAASGVSFTRPVSVSRNQEVELKVISYLDMGLAFGALIALAIGLLVARRPNVARAVRDRLLRKERVGAGRG